MEELGSLKAIVKGRVQGVFFRRFVQQHAERLELVGYVLNSPDGDVEVIAEGPKDRLADLLERLKTGPPAASVEAIEAEWHPCSGKYKRFEVRY